MYKRQGLQGNDEATASVSMTNVNEADLSVDHNISEVNYIVPNKHTVTMNKATITFTGQKSVPTYNGEAQTVYLVISGLQGNDEATASVSMTNVNETNLDVNHNISLVNYIVPNKHTVTMNKATITFTCLLYTSRCV